MSLDLAVIILTKNEEDQIADCIASAQLLNPQSILVLDSESTDNTRDLAEEFGATVHTIPWRGYVEQRNLAWDLTPQTWLLFLDADERVTRDFAQAIVPVLASKANGAMVYRRNWFQGAPLYCIEPDRLPRLGRRNHSRWIGGHVHEWLEIDGHCSSIKPPLLHRSWENLEEQLSKNQKYANLMAQTRIERGSRFRFWMLLRPIWAFPKFLLLRGGIREGKRGLLFSLTYFVYALQKIMYMLEDDIRKNGKKVPFPAPEKNEVDP